jgi:hypothetical protein
MGPSTTTALRIPKILPLAVTNVVKSRTRSAINTICLCLTHNGQRSLSSGKEVTKNGKIVKRQFLVYFVSEVLTRSKRYYSEMEKMLCGGDEHQKALPIF